MTWLAAMPSIAATGPLPTLGNEEYPIPGHGILVLEVPVEWQVLYVQSGDEGPPTLHMLPLEKNGSFQLSLTAYWYDGYDKDYASPATLRALVEEVGQRALELSPPQELAIENLEGGEGLGFFFDLSDDSAQAAGEYPLLTQGAMALGDIVLVFTLLRSDEADEVRETLFHMLRTARQKRLPGGGAVRFVPSPVWNPRDA